VNTRAGYMFQAESLMPWRTALQKRHAGLQFRATSTRAICRAMAAAGWSVVPCGPLPHSFPGHAQAGQPGPDAVLDPDIILMDEPFSALDVQTRQLMENEVLALWAAKKKRCCSSPTTWTSHRDERPRRVPECRTGIPPIGEFGIDLPRPRDVAEVRTTARFVELHQPSAGAARRVLKGYQQQLAA